MSIARKLTRFSRSEIDHLFAHAQRIPVVHGLTFFRAPAQKEWGRILIVTSRKVGNAPTRNKIRRRLKALFWDNRFYEKPFDIAIIVRKEATAFSFEELQAAFIKGLS